VAGPGSDVAKRFRDVRIGSDYVDALVDDHSRLLTPWPSTDERGVTCAGFLERAIGYFASHGITRIERQITDTAWAYRWSLSKGLR
jgi:hypothetical protein